MEIAAGALGAGAVFLLLTTGVGAVAAAGASLLVVTAVVAYAAQMHDYSGEPLRARVRVPVKRAKSP